MICSYSLRTKEEKIFFLTLKIFFWHILVLRIIVIEASSLTTIALNENSYLRIVTLLLLAVICAAETIFVSFIYKIFPGFYYEYIYDIHKLIFLHCMILLQHYNVQCMVVIESSLFFYLKTKVNIGICIIKYKLYQYLYGYSSIDYFVFIFNFIYNSPEIHFATTAFYISTKLLSKSCIRDYVCTNNRFITASISPNIPFVSISGTLFISFSFGPSQLYSISEFKYISTNTIFWCSIKYLLLLVVSQSFFTKMSI